MTLLERYKAFRPAFTEALDPRLYTIEHLDELVLQRIAVPFFSDSGAIVAGLKTYPTGAVALDIIIAAGPKDELVNDLYPIAEAWGRKQGCTIGLIESRPGWAKAMKRNGYEIFQVSIIKEL
jgi:hypothetical protein